MTVAGLVIVAVGVVLGFLRMPRWLRGQLRHPAPADWIILLLLVVGWVLVLA